MTVTVRPAVDPAIERYLARFEELRADLPGAGRGWVADLRAQAADALVRDGFPTTRVESWKYTDLRHVFRNEFVGETGSVDRVEADWLPEGDAPLAVFVDGRFSAELSRLEGVPQGVRVISLAEALDDGDEALERVLGSVAPLETPGLTALNTALMQDGAFIEVGDDVALEVPIRILCVSSAGFPGDVHLRHVMSLGRHAAATVVQAHVGAGASTGLCDAVTEASVEEGARLRFVKRQDESPSAWHIGLVQARLGRNASFDAFTLSSGARTARNEIRVRLMGEGAEATLNGLALGRDRQHCDNTTDIDHAVPFGTSNQLYKGVLDDRARAVFLGRILVAKDAQKTDARQMNRNLLLSPGAQADSKPELIIHADDVKCAHGATVGDLDREALFYLQSRGIGAMEARALLVQAFASEMIEAVGDEALRDWLGTAVERWLHHDAGEEKAA